MKQKEKEIVDDVGDPQQVLASHIKLLAEGVRKLYAGPLKKRAVILLLKDQTGVSMADIETVLDAAASLDKAVLKNP